MLESRVAQAFRDSGLSGAFGVSFLGISRRVTLARALVARVRILLPIPFLETRARQRNQADHHARVSLQVVQCHVQRELSRWINFEDPSSSAILTKAARSVRNSCSMETRE